jgi:two-component system, NarL family, nitrate/nitrite response regulator NarL
MPEKTEVANRLKHVLIIDDHPLIARGMQWLLKDDNGALEVRYATSMDSVSIELDSSHVIDTLVVLDLNMPGFKDLDAFHYLRSRWLDLKIAIWSGTDDIELILRALELNASGFIPKAMPPQQIAAAIRLILDGGVYIPQLALTYLKSPKAPSMPSSDVPIGQTAQGNFPANNDSALVPNEDGYLQRLLQAMPPRRREVLVLLASGASNKEICRKLNLSENTVKTHVGLIFSELQIHSRQSVTLLAHSNNLFRQFLINES